MTKSCYASSVCDNIKLLDGKNIRQITVNFVLKFSYFRCHGNKGRSDVNFNDTIKLLDL